MYNYSDKIELKPDEVLVYLRKSRTDEPNLSVEEVLERHETTLDEWAERFLGEKIPDSNKIREVVSGETIESRPGFLRLLKLIEHPRIRAVLVKDCARLGRPDLEEIGRISKIFRYTSTLVITPERTFDIADEWQRESFERELMKSNEVLNYYKKIQQAGRERSCADGWFIGNVPPYGYDRITVMDGKRRRHTLAINEEQAEVVRMIFDMYVTQDMGRINICHKLDELHITPPKGKHWSPASLRDMLANEHYVGMIRWNWKKTVINVEDGEIVKSRPKKKRGEYLLSEGKHPAIISDELFQAAQEKTGRNPRSKPSSTIRNPLAGLVYCQCGRAMTYRTYTKHDSPPRLLCDDQVHCHTGSCIYAEMAEIVANILRQKIAEYQTEAKANNDDVIKFHAQQIKNLKKRLSDLDEKELLQWEAQSDPDPAKRMPQHIFQTLNAKLLQEKEEVKQALAIACETMPDSVNYQKKIVTLQDALNALTDDDVSAAEKNRFLKACIEKIEYHRETPYRLKGTNRKGAWANPQIEVNVRLKV